MAPISLHWALPMSHTVYDQPNAINDRNGEYKEDG